MTWRTSRRYSKTGGRGYGAEPTPTSRPEPSRPPGGTKPIPTTRFDPMPTPDNRPPANRPRPTLPGPTLSFIPKGDTTPFHPPGPGIGIRPGPPRALGRPGLLPRDHGSWKNDSCFSPGSRGWKPDIMSIGDAHTCPGEKGPQSPFRPPNVSEDPDGYNTRLFRDEESVGKALQYIGYSSPDGNAMLRSFQRNWNSVISALAISPTTFSDLVFTILPQGNVRVDGDIGPHVLNALEVAVINQRLSNLRWPDIVQLTTTSDNGYGRQRRYNAAEGM